jgi:hypothetical protein
MLCGAPAYSHHNTVSLVQWVNRMHPHFWNWNLLVALSRNRLNKNEHRKNSGLKQIEESFKKFVHTIRLG